VGFPRIQKKKKIFLEPTWAAIKINFYLNGWRTSPIMKNSWVTEAKELKKKKKPFQFEIYTIPF
jgi:hypothetical protein